jgi:HEAT repeat protein
MMPLFGPPNIEKLTSEKDLKQLCKALFYKKDASIRRWAADALKDIGDASTVAPLLKAAGDLDFSVRAAVIQALTAIGDPRAVKALTTALLDTSTRVHNAALDGLIAFQDPRMIDPMVDCLVQRGYRIENRLLAALITFGEPAVEPLIAVLGVIKEPKLISQVATALGELGSRKAIEPLIQLEMRDSALRVPPSVFASFGAPAVQTLIAALDDPANQTATLAYLLGELGDPQATLPLVDLLDGGSEQVRFEVVQALGKIGDARALPALMNLLQSDQRRRIQDAVKAALSKMGAASLGLLVTALEGEDETTRRAAWQSLQAVGWQPQSEAQALLYAVYSGEVYNLGQVNWRKQSVLLHKIFNWDLDWVTRGALARMLLTEQANLPQEDLDRAEEEMERFNTRRAALIKASLETPQPYPWIDQVRARVLFEDYAEVIPRLSTYQKTESGVWEKHYHYDQELGLVALDQLCQVNTSLSSNLLIHLCELQDIEVSRGNFEMAYDAEHPTGMGEATMLLSFKKHRDLAAETLARRGNPAFDPAVYRQAEGWRFGG